MHCRRNGTANFDMLQKRGGAKGEGCNNLVHCKMRQSHNLTGLLVNLSVSQCIPARVTTCVLTGCSTEECRLPGIDEVQNS